MAHDTTIRRSTEADLPVLHELLAALSTEIGYGAAFRANIESLRVHGFEPHPLFGALLAEQADRMLSICGRRRIPETHPRWLFMTGWGSRTTCRSTR